MNGYIQFTILGGTEVRGRAGKQIEDADKDENSVVISKRHSSAFSGLRTAIEAAVVACHQAPAAPAPAAAPSSVADELGKLAGLRESGALSEEEFAAMKAKLLA